MIAETLRKHGKQAYVLLLDGVKAFDSVVREMNLRVLKKYGAPEEFRNVIAMALQVR